MVSYRFFLIFIILLFFSIPPVLAGNQSSDLENRLKEYINALSQEVKNTPDPEEKRQILNQGLKKLRKAFQTVQTMPGVSDDDRLRLSEMEIRIQEKVDELNGLNGFDKIPNRQLNQFSEYVVQDFEQARTLVISISVTTLLLIIIILLLL